MLTPVSHTVCVLVSAGQGQCYYPKNQTVSGPPYMSLQTACTAIAHSYSTLSTIKYHIKRRRTSSLVSFLHFYRFKAKSNMYYIPPKRVAVLPPKPLLMSSRGCSDFGQLHYRPRNPLLMSSRGCSVTLGTVRLAIVNTSYSPS